MSFTSVCFNFRKLHSDQFLHCFHHISVVSYSTNYFTIVHLFCLQLGSFEEIKAVLSCFLTGSWAMSVQKMRTCTSCQTMYYDRLPLVCGPPILQNGNLGIGEGSFHSLVTFS